MCCSSGFAFSSHRILAVKDFGLMQSFPNEESSFILGRDSPS